MEYAEVPVLPRISRPPPVFAHGILNYAEMMHNLTQILNTKQFSSKSLSYGSVKVNTYIAESYGSLIRYPNDEKILYHTCQLKDDRACRVVLRDILTSITLKKVYANQAIVYGI